MSHSGKLTCCGRCFPSGHASAGYGLLGLYFFMREYAPRWQWEGLTTGLGLGLIFGIAQQLRGAHFLSHDLWSLAICWCSVSASKSAPVFPLHS